MYVCGCREKIRWDSMGKDLLVLRWGGEEGEEEGGRGG